MNQFDEKVRILVVDDSNEVRDRLRSIVSEMHEAECVGTAANGITALEMVKSLKPDILLLDVIMPQLDGFGVMEYLSEQGEMPETIVISALTQENFIFRALNLGAKYYIAKPFENENIKSRIRDVIAMKRGVKSTPITKTRQTTLDEKISSVFISIGIPAHIKGYHFLREAVKMVVESPDSINRITKELYPTVARRCGGNPLQVERTIRAAIHSAWDNRDESAWNQVFHTDGPIPRPTNSAMISLLAEQLGNDDNEAS